MNLVELCAALLVSCVVAVLQGFDAVTFDSSTSCGTFYISLASVAFTVLRARQVYLGLRPSSAVEVLGAVTLPVTLLMVIVFWPTVFALDVHLCSPAQQETHEVRCGTAVRRVLTTVIHGVMPATVWYVALRGAPMRRRSFGWALTPLLVYACIYGSETDQRIYDDLPLLQEMGALPSAIAAGIILMIQGTCYAVYAALATK